MEKPYNVRLNEYRVATDALSQREWENWLAEEGERQRQHRFDAGYIPALPHRTKRDARRSLVATILIGLGGISWLVLAVLSLIAIVVGGII